MKHISLILLLLCLIIAAHSQTFSDIDYQGSDENFANPERGFYHFVNNVDYNSLVSFREEEAITLIYRNYKMEDYTESEIPLWYLQNMEKDFATMRKAGTKCVLRFSYTNKATPPYGDAHPDIVLRHVEQLKPYLQANSDVIYVLQAGFIGAWGEWYYTDYYKDWDDRRELMDALLDAMPASRQVQLRTPNYKQKIMERDDYVPVSEEEAYTNTPIARISHHNDCFVASSNDYGTYQDSAVEKPYLADDTKYTLMGGETCNECPCASCENSLLELRRFHWSYINIDYHTAVLQGWKDEGCYPEVERRLGFRYRLVSANIQNESKPNGKFNLSLKIINDGWANPGNPRDVELILRNTESGELYYLPLNEDPRKWPFTDTIFVSVEAGIPPSMAKGDYDVFLHLPDPEPKLANRPEYSIRTANNETWEKETGYNSLITAVQIKDDEQLPDYAGGNLFKPKNVVLPDGMNINIDGKSDDWELMNPFYTNNGQSAKEIKSYNNIDSMYFVITGASLQPASQLFIDADQVPETGYAAWQWSNNGADYLIENNFLYKYSGSNHEWGWTEIGTVSLAANDTVVEMGFGLNQLSGVKLNQSFSIGYTNDPQGSVQTSYIPLQNEPFLVISQVAIFGSPQALDATTYSNNNIVFWTNANASAGVYNILERSDDGINFEQVQINDHNAISHVDKDLEENKTYKYRLKFMNGNTYSSYQGPLEKTSSNVEKVFVHIKLDGEADDWKTVPPSGTGFDQEMVALRLTNQGDQLFYSLAGKPITDYKLFFDVEAKGSFNYKISNDSVYSIDGSTWIFKKNKQLLFRFIS